MMKKILFASAGALLLIGAGCGRSAAERTLETATGGQVKVENDGKNFEVRTDEGTVQWGAENKLPEGWPRDAPTYPGATVQFSSTATQEASESGFTVILLTNDTGATVLEYYKKELVSLGWKIEGTYQFGVSATMSATKDSRALGLSIASSEGKTSITESVMAK